MQDQHAALSCRLQGHFNYFGVNGNSRSLAILSWHAKRSWHQWLNRRSQRAKLNGQRFLALLQVYPLPPPRLVVSLWGG